MKVCAACGQQFSAVDGDLFLTCEDCRRPDRPVVGGVVEEDVHSIWLILEAQEAHPASRPVVGAHRQSQPGLLRGERGADAEARVEVLESGRLAGGIGQRRRERLVAERIPVQTANYVDRTMSYFMQDDVAQTNIRQFLNPWNDEATEVSLSAQNELIIDRFMPRFAKTDVSDEQVQAWYDANGFATAPVAARR